jgi:hypothetical protein
MVASKAVGKTATAERRATTVHRVDVPATRTIAAADPTVLLGDPPPVLLDEGADKESLEASDSDAETPSG